MSSSARTSAVLALALAACTPPEPEGATLRVVTTGDAAALIDANSAAGLTQPDGAGGVRPGLARSWRVADDGRSAVFRLRAARWPDGEAFTAREAAAAINAARARGPLAGYLAGVSATAPLPDVVEIQLASPRPELLELLAHPATAPRRAGRGLAPFARDNGRLVRAPAWPGEPPPLAAVTVRALAADAAIAAFAAGQADLVLGDGPPPPAAAVPEGALRLAPSRRALLLVVDWRRALADPALRQALSLAIDRAALAASLGGVPAATLTPPILGGGAPAGAGTDDGAGEPFVMAQERARALLAGATPAVTLAAAPGQRAIAERLSADWGAIGVAVRVVIGDPARTLAAGRADLALATRTAPAATPLAYLQGFGCSPRACVPAADAALLRARRADTPQARADAHAEADAALTAAGAAIPLAQLPAWALVSQGVAGWVDNPANNHPFGRLDLLPERTFIPGRRPPGPPDQR